VATVSPEIMAAMLAANSGTEAPYGEDSYSRLLDARLVTICRKLGKGFDEGA
jgi:threonine aldolase